MSRQKFLVSASVLLLAACSTSTETADSKTSAPMPPITEMDAAMSQPAPKPVALAESDTLTPIMPKATGNETTEERLARVEQELTSLRADYARIMPAFASLNTTNERIQKLLDELDRPGMMPKTASAQNDAPAPVQPPVTTTTTVTETVVTKPVTPPPVLSTPPASITTAGSAFAPGKVSTAPPDKILPAGSVKTAAMAEATPKPSPLMQPPVKKAAEPVPSPASTPVPSSEAQTANTEEEAGEEEMTASYTPEEAPAAGPATSAVKAVRIGEHGSKTRVVFDLDAPAKPDFSYDLDNEEGLLLVDMPSSAWKSGSEAGKPNSPLIAGWKSQPGHAGGTSVAIQLKKDARILSTQFLKAEGKDSARLVMDIAAGG
jgi:hypothetical protein